MVNLVPEGRAKGVDATELKEAALQYKREEIDTGRLRYEDWCDYGEVKKEYMMEVVEGFVRKVNLKGSSMIARNIGQTDIRDGLSIYFTLTYCNEEGFDLFHFHRHIMKSRSIPHHHVYSKSDHK
jgi:hypothetical protein